MPDLFHSRIDLSLADVDLQVALDGNAEKRITGRRQAFASIPDYQERRQRAHTVRADVVANLDRYLEQFVQRVQENGFIVHRAADAAQAVQMILEIIRQNQGKLVAKSKTMVSEEINLNHLLEAAGLRVVETDLGEFIVQIRGEKPSHIITPWRLSNRRIMSRPDGRSARDRSIRSPVRTIRSARRLFVTSTTRCRSCGRSQRPT